jgi:hypothetical protein
MITNFKLFENKEDPSSSFWYFNDDDFDRMVLSMNKFLTGKYTHNLSNTSMKSPATKIISVILKTIETDSKYSENKIMGIFLCHNNGNYSYWISTDQSDNNNDYIFGELEGELYEYRGDVKLDENDNIYVDKLNVEVRKYNL